MIKKNKFNIEVYIKRNSNSPTNVCPKITLRHLEVDGLSKMSVKLATQVTFFMNTIILKQ